MASQNIVKIGTALKWRDVYDNSKKYYQENLVTLNGCVFRCKILSAQGLPPVEIDEETRFMSYINPDVWDVVVDMAYYYNYVVAQENFNNMILGVVTEHDKRILQLEKDSQLQKTKTKILSRIARKHHSEIKELQKNSSNTNDKVNEFLGLLKKEQETNQQQEDKINQLLDAVAELQRIVRLLSSGVDAPTSVVSAGYWDTDLPWENDHFWNNRPKTQSGGSCDCDTDTSESVVGHGKWNNSLAWKNNKHWKNNPSVSDSDCCEGKPGTATSSVVSNGTWVNSMPWVNTSLWNNNTPGTGSCGCNPEDMTNLQAQVNELSETVKKQGQLIEELLKRLGSQNPVIVSRYEDALGLLELEGAIEVTDATEGGDVSLSLPRSIITYREQDKSIELS